MGRQLIRELDPLGEPARPTALELNRNELPSWLELPTMLRAMKLIDIYGTSPELRFTESDQTDPAGRFRFQGSAGGFSLYKALTANWATQEAILQHDITNKVTYLNAITAADWFLQLVGGNSLTTGGYIKIGENNGIELRTGNGSSAIARMILRANAAIPDIDIDQANLDLNGYTLFGVGALRGQGTQDLYIRSWRLVTDDTARRIVLDVLDPATNTVYPVAQAVPKAATPLWVQLAPNYVPTTSELDASFISFVVNASDQLVAYRNKAGVIQSLVIGTMV